MKYNSKSADIDLHMSHNLRIKCTGHNILCGDGSFHRRKHCSTLKFVKVISGVPRTPPDRITDLPTRMIVPFINRSPVAVPSSKTRLSTFVLCRKARTSIWALVLRAACTTFLVPFGIHSSLLAARLGP
eukprot:UN03982